MPGAVLGPSWILLPMTPLGNNALYSYCRCTIIKSKGFTATTRKNTQSTIKTLQIPSVRHPSVNLNEPPPPPPPLLSAT